MGNWQLELFKMSICVTFPVIMFYLYNQPHLFEDWVIEKKRELYPPSSISESSELKDFIKSYKAKKDTEALKKLQDELETHKD